MTGSAGAGPRPLGRFLAAYRGQISIGEAARRAGVSKTRWEDIEAGADPVGREGPTLPAHTVAAMCVAVGADVVTGLALAGHDPRDYQYLVRTPPLWMHLSRPRSPRIVAFRAIIDAATGARRDPRPAIAAIYRDAALDNEQLAERLTRSPPDARAEYWQGYADALRAIAEEQTRAADTDATPSRGG